MTAAAISQRSVRPQLLRLAQIGWWLTLALCLTLVGPSALQMYQDERTICKGATCAPDQLNAVAAHSLSTIGWTTQTYAGFMLGLSIISMLIWLSVGVFFAWRKWSDVMALLIAMQAVTQAVSPVVTAETYHPGPWLVLAVAFSFFSFVFLVLVFALFPNGHFVPRWQVWIIPVFIAFDAITSAPITGYSASAQHVIMTLSNYVWFGLIGLILIGQVYRYRHVTNEVERQQTKWIVFAFVAIIVLQFVYYLPMALSPELGNPDSLYSLATNPTDTVITLIAPACIAIAVMRYRLYDIDVIIKRTLVYGPLTAILAALYFGLVIGAQQLTHRLTGQQVAQQPVVIVLSTLFIAALFTPLRRWLQRGIDRRFYRSRYDASRTLAAFSASLRSEINAQQLHDHLLAVVEETMQPSSVMLWLRPASEAGQRAAQPRGQGEEAR
jgi:hypothetical protein